MPKSDEYPSKEELEAIFKKAWKNNRLETPNELLPLTEEIQQAFAQSLKENMKDV